MLTENAYTAFFCFLATCAKSGLKIDLALIVCVLRRFAVLVGGVISTREGG